ncbi:hypothetical protein ERX27_10725 [Macrococcus brunensis]|uniref:Uncharacterized protein n=1 Tax=Macrococcus brunensis TaxID=198483 RepID=A0A4R6BAP0_9STAP|nr:hypothetical protein [Macrococcus brunensis]TDL93360.1 hypothetical protein ERX27_10725 [Macrococcus brunensis]
MKAELLLIDDLINHNQKIQIVVHKQLDSRTMNDLVKEISVHKELPLQITINTPYVDIMPVVNAWAGESFELICYKVLLTPDMLDEIAEAGIVVSVESEYDLFHITLLHTAVNSAVKENNLKQLQPFFSYAVQNNEQSSFLLQQALLDAENEIAKLNKERTILQGQYDRLKRRYQSYGIQQKENEFAKLQQKYKETLHRLNNLRESRLGKLQIKYWDLRK